MVKHLVLKSDITGILKINIKDNLNLGLELSHNESSIDDSNRKYLPANAYGNNGCEMDSKGSQDLKSFDALKIKLGFTPKENANIYLAAGPAIGRVKASIVHKWDGEVGGCGGSKANSDTQSESGYAVSLGGEYLFNSNWSIKAEYTRLELSDTKLKLYQASNNSHELSYKFENSYDLFNVGLNYYFR